MTCCPALTGVRMTLSPTTTLSPFERSCKENALLLHNLWRAVWPCRRGTCRTSFPHFQMGQDSPEYNYIESVLTKSPSPWPAFKGPTRMAFFSSKAGRRLLTVKYLGTIYPCDTRKMLGIIRWCCKNTQCIEIWLSAHLFDLMWRSWTTLPYCITLPSALEEDIRSKLT